ncbi:hypothetical protein LCGC14_0765710 [marine sediment metagenome]|uniref:Radical SAM core domain-containing protein n=1 Tax=marine sediment metagenome TaxID=412755 RepID=A0A0F9Q418_9ZZZZ|nr:MAG: S-adenosyl-L-methionine-dependent tRNA 4-demethylwyosine synthase [Candidatus Lokiarchaeum sp. GC14_75]
MKNQYIVDNRISNKFVETYTKTTYRIVGENKHSSIKPCHWLEQKLMTGRSNRNCYKGIFGVESHRCLQNTPSLPFCNHQCVFCWRDIEIGSLGSEFVVKPDEPKIIVNEMLRHHQDIIKNHLPLRRYLDNYEIMLDILHYMVLKGEKTYNINSLMKNIHVSKNKIERAINLLKNQNFIKQKNNLLAEYELDDDIQCCINSREEIEILVNRALTTPNEIMQTHSDAMIPNHAAISLDGEPMLYPNMSDFIQQFKNRSMTTFIVTNGTLPEKIRDLDPLPSQLYVTLPAPDELIYKRACRPMVKKGWDKINETLELLDSLSCRTLVRLTAVKNLNVDKQYIKNYISLVKKANPNFFEIKGFTLQAKALLIKDRMNDNYPTQHYFPDYEFLEDFSLRFEKISGFPIIYKSRVSRDFLFAVNWDKEKDPKITKV